MILCIKQKGTLQGYSCRGRTIRCIGAAAANALISSVCCRTSRGKTPGGVSTCASKYRRITRIRSNLVGAASALKLRLHNILYLCLCVDAVGSATNASSTRSGAGGSAAGSIGTEHPSERRSTGTYAQGQPQCQEKRDPVTHVFFTLFLLLSFLVFVGSFCYSPKTRSLRIERMGFYFRSDQRMEIVSFRRRRWIRKRCGSSLDESPTCIPPTSPTPSLSSPTREGGGRGILLEKENIDCYPTFGSKRIE